MSYPVRTRERGTGWSEPHLTAGLLPSIERPMKQCLQQRACRRTPGPASRAVVGAGRPVCQVQSSSIVGSATRAEAGIGVFTGGLSRGSSQMSSAASAASSRKRLAGA
jgi:hypothetical protein